MANSVHIIQHLPICTIHPLPIKIYIVSVCDVIIRMPECLAYHIVRHIQVVGVGSPSVTSHIEIQLHTQFLTQQSQLVRVIPFHTIILPALLRIGYRLRLGLNTQMNRQRLFMRYLLTHKGYYTIAVRQRQVIQVYRVNAA